jgi:hypothetical protein
MTDVITGRGAEIPSVTTRDITDAQDGGLILKFSMPNFDMILVISKKSIDELMRVFRISRYDLARRIKISLD